MNRPLTGDAAVEAISLYARLGASGARFDAGKVAASVRSRAGRLRLSRAIAFAVRRLPPACRPAARSRGRRARCSATRPATRCASKSPGRPAHLTGGTRA